MNVNSIKKLSVSTKASSYNIYFGNNIFGNSEIILKKYIQDRKIIIVYDQKLEEHIIKLKTSISYIASELELIRVLGSEKSKSLEKFSSLSEEIINKGVDRESILIAFGGGVIGDLVGFIASTLLRGIDFIQIPSTLLAQVDSSIGGKTGINSFYGKNLIGSFHQPIAVLSDVSLLNTLSKRELISGYAEIVKHGLIKDKKFFEWLKRFGSQVIYGDKDLRIEAISKACSIKREIVQEDEFERGQRALLNLGHTFGHAIESYLNYDGTVLHGEAVSIGIIMAHKLSVKIGSSSKKDLETILTHFKEVGLPISITDLTDKISNTEKLWSIMQNDKKVSNGKLNFIIPEKIGLSKIRNDISSDDVLTILNEEIAYDRY